MTFYSQISQMAVPPCDKKGNRSIGVRGRNTSPDGDMDMGMGRTMERPGDHSKRGSADGPWTIDA